MRRPCDCSGPHRSPRLTGFDAADPIPHGVRQAAGRGPPTAKRGRTDAKGIQISTSAQRGRSGWRHSDRLCGRSNQHHPTGRITDHGRELLITGPITVTAGEVVHLKVTVTQRSTGALAEGTALLRGTGTPGVWQVEADVSGHAAFQPGPATAVALAVCTSRHRATDSHQWLVNITLTQ